MQVSLLAGSVERPQLSRTFTDGQLFGELTIIHDNGDRQLVSSIFCPNRLIEALLGPGSKQIYIWRRHVFAIKQGEVILEDIQGVKRSYLTRDLPALGLMTASIVLMPYALWVAIRKVWGMLSMSEMKDAIGNA